MDPFTLIAVIVQGALYVSVVVAAVLFISWIPLAMPLAVFFSVKINKGANFGTWLVWLPLISHAYTLWAVANYGFKFLFFTSMEENLTKNDSSYKYDDNHHHQSHPAPVPQ